jgi:hypothetical protein
MAGRRSKQRQRRLLLDVAGGEWGKEEMGTLESTIWAAGIYTRCKLGRDWVPFLGAL